MRLRILLAIGLAVFGFLMSFYRDLSATYLGGNPLEQYIWLSLGIIALAYAIIYSTKDYIKEHGF